MYLATRTPKRTRRFQSPRYVHPGGVRGLRDRRHAIMNHPSTRYSDCCLLSYGSPSESVSLTTSIPTYMATPPTVMLKLFHYQLLVYCYG